MSFLNQYLFAVLLHVEEGLVKLTMPWIQGGQLEVWMKYKSHFSSGCIVIDQI